MSNNDFDTLLNEAVQTAFGLLEKNGDFYPFAVAMDLSGETALVVSEGEQEFPDSKEVLRTLRKCLKSEVDSYKAVGVVSNVNVTDTTINENVDAIAVELEHVDDEPIVCFLPYTISDGQIEYSEVAAQPGQSNIFG